MPWFCDNCFDQHPLYICENTDRQIRSLIFNYLLIRKTRTLIFN